MTNEQIDKETLIKVRSWAQEKIHIGHEPPWSWYQYMKLIETLDTIIQGINSVVMTSTDVPLTVIDNPDLYKPTLPM